MEKPIRATPKDFFVWLGALITMYGSVAALIALLFQYIDYSFPDPLEYYYADPYSGPIRFAMATLIVLVPVAILLMRIIRKDIAHNPMKNDLWVRRWALVLTVFLAAAIAIGDLITLINYFLGGELTARFLLKVAVVLLVAGGVFFHFLADLRGYWAKNADKANMVGIAAGILVILSITAGFFIMGSPAQVRLYRFDDQKVQDLTNIQWQLVNYYQQKERLPDALSELEDPISGFITPTDPQTGETYLYQKEGDESFRLCAQFNTESRQSPTRPTYNGISENWEHAEGETCFSRVIDPERYPPFEKPVPAR